MNKEEVLAEVKRLVSSGELTRAEALTVFDNSGQVSPAITAESRSSFLSKANFHDLLYYVGGAIVFIGLSVFIGQNWESLGSWLRILCTLGSFVGFYAAASVWSQRENLRQAANAFFLLAYLLLPLGLGVTLYEAGVKDFTAGLFVLLSALCAAAALGSFYVFKNNSHLFFGFVFATIFELSLLSWIHSLFGVQHNWKRDTYVILGTGIAYLSFGYYWLVHARPSLAGFANFFGLAAIVSSGLALGEWKPEANVLWELLFPLLAFTIIFASLPLKSKLYLVFGMLGLIGYITKLTAEYFSDSLGWPLAIVVAGLLIMASGYAVFVLRQRYRRQALGVGG